MQMKRAWSNYGPGYRARELKRLTGWIQAGHSGSVVGSAGIGKSNLLGFLGNRPEVIQAYLPANSVTPVVISVDLNNLPANDTSTLYRVILRAFYESRKQFDDPLPQIVTTLYIENRAASDPFLPHSALRELFLDLQSRQIRVVLILDRFDWFCENTSPEMTGTLRGLRDSFKESICYIAGMRQEVRYLADPAALGELYELLDTHVCWVQPMALEDARQLIADEMIPVSAVLEPADVERLLTLTDRYPSLLKAACSWWLKNRQAGDGDWIGSMIASPSMGYRLEKIKRSLTLAEQQVLQEINRWQEASDESDDSGLGPAGGSLDDRQEEAARLLITRGLLIETASGRRIGAPLFAAFVGQDRDRSPGAIWYDAATGLLYQGKDLLDGLTPLEHSLLTYLAHHPRTRHTHTDLIEAVWPEDTIREGVSTEALYQVVRGLRRKIEPSPSRPRYIVNWRGTPEGGYQCFAEGRPE